LAEGGAQDEEAVEPAAGNEDGSATDGVRYESPGHRRDDHSRIGHRMQHALVHDAEVKVTLGGGHHVGQGRGREDHGREAGNRTTKDEHVEQPESALRDRRLKIGSLICIIPHAIRHHKK